LPSDVQGGNRVADCFAATGEILFRGPPLPP
jgi:hypothetical protein